MEVIKSLYKELEKMLEDFATTLADESQGRAHGNTPAGTQARFNITRFLRRLWSVKVERR